MFNYPSLRYYVVSITYQAPFRSRNYVTKHQYSECSDSEKRFQHLFRHERLIAIECWMAECLRRYYRLNSPDFTVYSRVVELEAEELPSEDSVMLQWRPFYDLDLLGA